MKESNESSQPAGQRPHIYVSVRPSGVPSELSTLAPDTEITATYGVPDLGTTQRDMTAAELVAHINDTICRHTRGAFYTAEAAFLLAEALGLSTTSLSKRMEAAFKAGALFVREAGSELKKHPSEPFGRMFGIVYENDINAWLASEGVAYRFPVVRPTASSADATNVKPLQREAAWDQIVLAKLVELGFDPMRLEYRNGVKSRAKQAVKADLKATMGLSPSIVDGAWKRLSKDDRIKSMPTLDKDLGVSCPRVQG